MKLRPYLALIIAGSVALAAAVALSVWLWRNVRRHGDVSARLDATMRDLKRLGDRVPFPNEANVAAAETNRIRIEAFFNGVMDRFLQRQFRPPSMEPARFPQYLQRAIQTMNLSAVSNNVAVPERFMYGFDRYAKGQPPAKAEIPRLAWQVHVIETITRAIFSAKIRELSAVARHVFEDEVKPDGAAPPGAGEVAAPGPAGGVAAGYLRDARGLYVRERAVFEFRARESSVWEILNVLPRLPVFCVVSDIDLQNDAPRPAPVNPADGQRIVEGLAPAVAGSLPPDEAAFGPGARLPAAGAVVPVSAAALAVPRRPLKREERTVAGMAETLKVRLQVDYYIFQRPGAEAQAEEEKQP